jgi:hypothetical protein
MELNLYDETNLLVDTKNVARVKRSEIPALFPDTFFTTFMGRTYQKARIVNISKIYYKEENHTELMIEIETTDFNVLNPMDTWRVLA